MSEAQTYVQLLAIRVSNGDYVTLRSLVGYRQNEMLQADCIPLQTGKRTQETRWVFFFFFIQLKKKEGTEYPEVGPFSPVHPCQRHCSVPGRPSTHSVAADSTIQCRVRNSSMYGCKSAHGLFGIGSVGLAERLGVGKDLSIRQLDKTVNV